jgi:hypothetical protein
MLFDVLVHDCHGWHRSQSPSYKRDIDATSQAFFEQLSEEHY